MRSQPERTIDERAVAVWRWSAAIWGVFLIGMGVTSIVLAMKYNWTAWIPWVVCVGAVLELIFSLFILPPLRWRRWRYEIREEEIDLLQGVIFVKRTVIPMVRIQHVDTNQGPILRKYGLAGVTFSTAAGSHSIPALAEHTADRVRDQIAELARVSHEDV